MKAPEWSVSVESSFPGACIGCLSYCVLTWWREQALFVSLTRTLIPLHLNILSPKVLQFGRDGGVGGGGRTQFGSLQLPQKLLVSSVPS